MSDTSANSDTSRMVKLPVPKISQSLNVQKEDFVDFHTNNAGYNRSKTKKHKHIDFYYDKTFLKDYFKSS